jgi:phage terminase large subunit-like protein
MEFFNSRNAPSIVAQSWDIALMTGSGNDFSVGTTWDMLDYYLHPDRIGHEASNIF